MSETQGGPDLVAEMGGADFGDPRISRRLPKIVESIVASPDKSLPAVFDETELEGAYRFFNNKKVSPTRILEPHVRATVGRMATEATSLVVHDTSTMSFDPDGKRRGLGRIRTAGQAFFAHVSLALSGDGSRRPLGVLAFATHIRTGKHKKKRKKTKDNPDSERARWGQQVTAVASLGIDRSKTVHLMDREADDYALFAQLVENQDRFVIRVSHDRHLEAKELGDLKKLAAAVTQIQTVAEREVPLSRRPDAKRSPQQKRTHPTREGRMAKLAFGATKVVILRPSSQPKTLAATLTLNIVRVWEVDVPEGDSPVEWVLVTTEPVDTAEQILQVVDWYRARWVIEEFFKAIKTGCAYESRQFETLAALLNVLATFMPVAWRLLLMRTQARIAPDAPAESVLPAPMLIVLQKFTRITLPQKPTAREALLAVAALGGHQKHNGEPGWLTIGRGYEKLRTLTEGWTAHAGVALGLNV